MSDKRDYHAKLGAALPIFFTGKLDEFFTSELATLRGHGVLGSNVVLKDPYVLGFLRFWIPQP
ncbi:MAG: hypothetical protein V4754_12320 [Pseudomonadota bacterium]